MSQGMKDFLFAVFVGTVVLLFIGWISYTKDHEKVPVFGVTNATAKAYPKPKPPPPTLPEGVVMIDVSKFLVKPGAERQIKYICTKGASDGSTTPGVNKFQFVNGWWYVECWSPQKQY